MLCSELMSRDVERCLDSSLITEAASAMRDRNVGFLPVTTEDTTAVGTITDRDIAIRVLADDRPPDLTPVSDVMTHEVVTCSPDDDLQVAEDLMSRFQKGRIVCTDAQRHVLGVISLSNIAHTESGGHAASIAASIATRESLVPGELPANRAEAGRKLTCLDVINRDVLTCSADTPVTEVAALMRDRNVGFVPITDERGAVTGTVTDRDLVVRVVCEGRSPKTTRAGDIQTLEFVSCSADAPLQVAEDLMVLHKKSRILCTDESGRALGVISLSDISRVEREEQVAELLRALSRIETELPI